MKHHPHPQAQPPHRLNFAEYLKQQRPDEGDAAISPPVNLHHVAEAMRQARAIVAMTGGPFPSDVAAAFMDVLRRALMAL